MVNDALQKNELRFWLPIIISIVSVVLSWGALTTRIALVEQKQDDILAGIQDIKEGLKEHVADQTSFISRLVAVETKVNKGGD